ncbi:MAG: toxin-antitoxin system YwqK family antitoxin [Sphingomonadales bacterium]|jgi:antitoxin component YwqK of YwqJK toxin-antitoxin module
MKGIILLIVLSTLFLQGCVKFGGELVYNKEEPDIGDLNGKLTYKKQLYSGNYVRYYDDGSLSQLMERGSYKNGVKHGDWEYYHENGQLSSKGAYSNGAKEGVWEEYHGNGQLKFKYSYISGRLRDDVWEEYHENGKLKMKGSYLNGKKDGVWEYYNEDGSLNFCEEYNDNGKLLRTTIIKNGLLQWGI